MITTMIAIKVVATLITLAAATAVALRAKWIVVSALWNITNILLWVYILLGELQ